jgi:hypothetical protein
MVAGMAVNEYQRSVMRSQLETFRARVSEWQLANSPSTPETAPAPKLRWTPDATHRAAEKAYYDGWAEARKSGARRPNFRCSCEACRTNSVESQLKLRVEGLLDADLDAAIWTDKSKGPGNPRNPTP